MIHLTLIIFKIRLTIMYPQERILANEQHIKKLLEEIAENDLKLTKAIKRVEENRQIFSNLEKSLASKKNKIDSL